MQSSSFQRRFVDSLAPLPPITRGFFPRGESVEGGRKRTGRGVSRSKGRFHEQEKFLSLTPRPLAGPANPSVEDLVAADARKRSQPAPFLQQRSNEELGRLAGQDIDETIQTDAFSELFRRLWRATVEWAGSMGGVSSHHAEDAATQAWLRAWRYRHGYDPERALYGTWLRRIVRNETVDLLNQAWHCRQRPVGETDYFQRADPVSQDDCDATAFCFVCEAFEALKRSKPDFAAVLSLKAEGYRDKQICLKLGLESEGTVGSRAFRAKQYMAEWLADQRVVFLPQDAVGSVHPWGLNPLCTISGGRFYSFSPLDGLFALTPQRRNPPGSVLVCTGFFIRLWAYPLDRYRVSTSPPTEQTSRVIFKWNQYLVSELMASRGVV